MNLPKWLKTIYQIAKVGAQTSQILRGGGVSDDPKARLKARLKERTPRKPVGKSVQ